MELYSEEVERVVLANLIVYKDTLIYTKQINKSDFMIGRNQIVFEIIKNLYEEGKPVDIISIKEAAQAKNYNGSEILIYCSEISDAALTSSNIDFYIKKLKNFRVRRQLKDEAQAILKFLNEGDGDEEAGELKKEVLNKISAIETSQVNLEEKEMTNIMVRTTEELEKRYNNKEKNKLETGFWKLDVITDGLHEQEFTVIAARPGVGKTSIGLNIAEHIASKGTCVYFVSMEMSEIQLGNRLIASHSELDGHKLRQGWLNDEEWGKVGQAVGDICKLKMIIDTQSITVQDIETKAYELKQLKDIGLIVIDYLQLIKSKDKFSIREQEVSDISRRLKLLSRDLNIPVVALCQLNRETEKRKRPMLADLRESGAIEQDADNVIFLYASEEEKAKQASMDVEVIVAKQRNGPTGQIFLKFDKKTMTFHNKAY